MFTYTSPSKPLAKHEMAYKLAERDRERDLSPWSTSDSRLSLFYINGDPIYKRNIQNNARIIEQTSKQQDLMLYKSCQFFQQFDKMRDVYIPQVQASLQPKTQWHINWLIYMHTIYACAKRKKVHDYHCLPKKVLGYMVLFYHQALIVASYPSK